MTSRRVREAAPVQVYLIADERERLERLADQLHATKSDVIRRALLALERELLSPSAHPALRLIGIADGEATGVSSRDPAREHDDVLAEGEEVSWRGAASWRRPRPAGGAKKKTRRER